MTEHTGLPVSGYKPQTDKNVALVNENKALEELVLRQMDKIASEAAPGAVDGRWYAIARTDIEKGFMALNRAIFQPGRVALPEDEKSAA